MAGKVDCSPLQGILAQLAYHHASDPNVRNADMVFERMKKDIPPLTREAMDMAVNAFEKSKAAKGINREVSQFEKTKHELQFEGRLRDKLALQGDNLKNAVADPKTPRAKKARNATITALQEAIKAGRKQMAELQAAQPESIEAARLKKIDRAVQAAEALRKRLEAGDFARPEKKPAPWDNELEMALLKKEQMVKALRHEIEAIKPKTNWQKFGRAFLGVNNVKRGLMFSGEVSPITIQGAWALLSHPKMTAKSVARGFSAAPSDLLEAREMARIESNPKYALAKKAKVPYLDQTSPRPENTPSGLLEKLPVYSHVARFTRVMLKDLSMNLFDMMTDIYNVGPDDMASAKGFARTIGTMLGQPVFEGSTKMVFDVAGAVTNAPRLYVSRLQALVGEPIWNNRGLPKVQKASAMEYARATASLAVIAAGLAAVNALRGKETEWNPLSTDFMKYVSGEAHVSVIPGQYSTWLTFLSRILTFHTKNAKGKIVPLAGEDVKWGQRDISATVGTFARGRQAPALSMIWDALTQTDFSGRPQSRAQWAANVLNPIPVTYRDSVQMWMSELGMPEKLALQLYAELGGAVNMYGPETDRATEAMIPPPFREALSPVRRNGRSSEMGGGLGAPSL